MSFTLSVIHAECLQAECLYAECRGAIQIIFKNSYSYFEGHDALTRQSKL
jgi:hypothetical protein